jgi:peptidoglycan/LPS O-acetylase OafA/YrhL
MTSKVYWPYLDSIRFISVVCVLVVHLASDRLQLVKFNIGHYGVDVFFTLSGFLITYFLIEQKERRVELKLVLKGFYLKRFLRLFPLYYSLLILTLFVEAVFTYNFNVTNHILWYVGYLQNYLHVIMNERSLHYLNPSWSLAVEEQFYLIWPFVVLLTSKEWLLKWIVLFITLGFLSFWIFKTYDLTGPTRYLTVSNFHTLGVGALLAYCIHYYSDFFTALVKPRIVYILLISFLVFLAAYNYMPFLSFNYTKRNLLKKFLLELSVISTTFSLVYYSYLGFPGNNIFLHYCRLVLKTDFVVYVGKISYGIYLLHYPIVTLFDLLTGSYLPALSKFLLEHKVIHLTTYVVLIMLIAHLSYKYLEIYFLKKKHKFNF